LFDGSLKGQKEAAEEKCVGQRNLSAAHSQLTKTSELVRENEKTRTSLYGVMRNQGKRNMRAHARGTRMAKGECIIGQRVWFAKYTRRVELHSIWISTISSISTKTIILYFFIFGNLYFLYYFLIVSIFCCTYICTCIKFLQRVLFFVYFFSSDPIKKTKMRIYCKTASAPCIYLPCNLTTTADNGIIFHNAEWRTWLVAAHII